jgi:shikimate kinase
MPCYDKIYLIGFMGSGKSTMGRTLAKKLGWTFVDIDKRIEARAGMTIPEIFSVHGEEWFRNVESEVLRSFGSLSSAVISTGGGAPCHGDNMDFMLETGLTIYLKMSAEQLKRRLADSSGERPLLKGLTGDKLLEYIKNKLAEREKWYGRAAITVDSLNAGYSVLLPVLKGYLESR